MWAGAEVFRQVWSLYAGGTYAPFGSVREDGFRVRAVTGYGAYRYASPRWTGTGTQIFQFHGTTAPRHSPTCSRVTISNWGR